METLTDALKELGAYKTDYEFVSTDEFGNFHYRMQDHPQPELENEFFMALYKDEGIGEDNQSLPDRDYELIKVKVLSTRIGKTKEGCLACFATLETVSKLPEWYEANEFDFTSVNISLLCDNEFWTPVGQFELNEQEY